jgi:hypothetical protein
MKAKPFNGHRSWNAWNVSLWLNNDEPAYNEMVYLVRKYGRKKAANIMARDYAGQSTPDGAKYNRLCIYEAMEGI